MIAVPAATAVTKPVVETVAMVVEEEVHGPVDAAVPLPVNCDVVPTHAERVPVMFVAAFTVNVAVVVHPALFLYVMIVVPGATARTVPDAETVAIVVAEEVQAFVPGVPLPVNIVLPPTQADNVPLIVGFAITVNVAVEEQPTLLKYVIVVVPAATAVTKPVVETVATLGAEDVQAFEVAAVPLPVNCDVALIHAESVPVIVGPAETVNVAVVVQPVLFLYVIVAVPAATAVTNPVEETVAILVAEEVHGPVVAAVPLPVNCDVAPTHAESVPVMVGPAITVNVAVVVHPALFLYVMIDVPGATPRTVPDAETVAMFVAEEVQAFVPGVPLPVNNALPPTQADNVPVIVGFALTVKVAVDEQPALFKYVIVVVPAATAVTKPVVDTVAILFAEDDQAFEVAAVPLPVNCDVALIHAESVPVIVGPAVTLNVAVVEQPALFK
jgi:hypothetical protein